MRAAVVVTGACGGIGSSTVRLLISRGTSVVGIDKRPDVIRDLGANYRGIMADITDDETLARAISDITDQVEPSHAILVAGGALDEEIRAPDPLAVDTDVFRRSVDVNLVGQYLVIKHLVPFLANSSAQDRSITLVSSINAMGDFGYPAYSAAKAALSGITATLAVPLGRRNIRLNAVAFGTVLTDRSHELHDSDLNHFARLRRLAALPRLLTQEDAARTLVSVTELVGLTGAIIPADCGQVVPGNHSR